MAYSLLPMQNPEPLVSAKQDLLLNRIGTDAPAVHALELLNIASQLVRERDDLLRDLDMTDGRLGTLLAVSDQPETGPAALAVTLGITRATVSSLVERLYKAGLLERETAPDDRRSQVLRTTDAGEQKLAEVVPALTTWLNDAGQRIAAADGRDGGNGGSFHAVLRALAEG